MSSESFADHLRAWRERRGLSQLALAGQAGISQRHISFLELGRSRPSREMVDRLAIALGVPLRQHNELLLAAGFAPEWHERDLAAPDMSAVTSALDYILKQQEPYPAVVVDRHWNLLRSNDGAARLVEFLTGPTAPGAAVNLADALVGPDGLKPHLRNWPEVVRHFIRSIEADAAVDGWPETAALLKRLLGYRGVRAALRQESAGGDAGPVLPMHFHKDGKEITLFTTIATLGTPQDVTAAEIRIESFFPMDAATQKLMHDWAREGVRATRTVALSTSGGL
ncbi:helix-turn-helix domain-containing protein [Bradyrhizobium sp. RDI18]|uniref:helix-turn-helix domain-containing protein n=1 Tax=Bradyrhizobium sp. RDI18 TaxID=3367400 RepID=UPI00371389F0